MRGEMPWDADVVVVVVVVVVIGGVECVVCRGEMSGGVGSGG
jgi:hypothetical protein